MTEQTIAALAIDGPAGSGKSTVARAVAAKLNFVYLDTGAMYRALAWKAAVRGTELNDEAALTELARQTQWEFRGADAVLWLDGRDVSKEIRSPEITGITKYVARTPGVREILVARQRQLAAAQPSVMEGRDITTVVLPNAKWRVFLTAAPEIRAERRQRDFLEKGFTEDYQKILTDIIARDASDNEIGPLKTAREIAERGAGIMLLDTSRLAPEEVIDAVVKLTRI
jgi:cytidylate kinase